jgi:hypothetical protein
MIDYVIISSDDNPMYKDFYPIIAKRWHDLGFKTYYVNITDKNSIEKNEWGYLHNIKALDFVSTAFQSQVVRLFCSKFIDGNLLMSDIDMLPINKDYFLFNSKELTDENVVLYSGQPYGVNPFYPMCYVLSNSKTFIKFLEIQDLNFEEYCKMLLEKYGKKWNTDENFMYDKFQNHHDKLIIKKNRDFNRRIDRGNWNYNIEDLKDGYYIDSHILRPYQQYKEEIDKLINYL